MAQILKHKITWLTGIEALAVLLGASYTILITYGYILCWPAAIGSSVLFIYLVARKKLYAETVLHSFYLVMAIYGWITWGSAGGEQEVITWGAKQHTIAFGVGLLAALLTGLLLRRFSDARLPILDSITTAFSFVATYMMIHMVLENWIYWIIIDALSVILYFQRGLYISSLLFVAYTILAINGLIEWM